MDRELISILRAINSNLYSIAKSFESIQEDIEVAVLWTKVEENLKEDDDSDGNCD